MNSDSDRLARGREVIGQSHRVIWDDWFACIPGAVRADFRLTHGCADSGYRPERNELHLSLPEVNVEEAADEGGADRRAAPPPCVGWPVWKRELVHEMLHEYQHKVLAWTASTQGMALEAKSPRRFTGPRHGADFFTAIELKAAYFGISAECLVSNL